MLENTEEDRIYTTTCELVEIGPLNSPDIKFFESIKTIIYDRDSKWWADFSTWEDFYEILRSGK